MQAFRNDYLSGYTNLIYEHSGITIFPLSFYESLQQPTNKRNYIIDYSSLAILYQIAKEHDITYPHKFLISLFTVDMIKKELRKIQLDGVANFSCTIS